MNKTSKRVVANKTKTNHVIFHHGEWFILVQLYPLVRKLGVHNLLSDRFHALVEVNEVDAHELSVEWVVARIVSNVRVFYPEKLMLRNSEE